MSKKQLKSIRVDSELWKKVKVQSIIFDMTLENILDEALREWINNRDPNEEKEE